ncbi:uncharacterized protein LOC120689306 [Panicum virgatum]|uniref:uncharacterized protein LOC120689306 n=1 Tax=Panicum virgatum TaxID=38727 RepID=UPI0019D5356E|nr:uncharacterized protein LOC120689306 [Panicum virgatum]
MSSDIEDQSIHSDDSIADSEKLEEMMWEGINDPMQAEIDVEIEAEHEAQLVAQQQGALGNWSPYFRLRQDAFGKVGLSPLQKCTAAIRMLAYGTPADLMDETFGVAESTAMESMINFVQGVRYIFGQQYLRRPNEQDIQFTVNGKVYNMGYYLADGIYSEWATFVKPISRPQSAKHKLYANYQESARKDVELAFGVLQKRWAIIRHPARLWEQHELANIMYACVILHNMIVEDERGSYGVPDENTYEQGQFSPQMAGLAEGPVYGFTDVLEKNDKICEQLTAVSRRI